ncbi:MAG: SURF1 family protein [Microbacteriaceae bacterium]|nr:SURF1 family protein [Microbacteriaceae bacterium]
MKKTYQGWNFLLSRRWLGYYGMLVIFAIGCVLLSNWQFDRREEARQEISRIVTNYDQQPQPLELVLPTAASFNLDKHKWLPVEFRGEYVGQPALVRNRPGAGGTGSILVQAFRTESGALIMIDRGWVALTVDQNGAADFSRAPVAQPGQKTTVVGRLRASEPPVDGRTATVNSVGSINAAELAGVTGSGSDGLLHTTYAMLISENPESAHGTLPKKPDLDEGPHLSYALQWVVFIGIAAVGAAYAARQEFRHFNRGSAKVAEMDAKKAARKRRRGTTDAEEEDALLDDL